MIRKLLASTLAWIVVASSAHVHAQSRDTRPPAPVLVSPAPTQGVQPPAPAPPPSVERMRHPTDGRSGYWLDEDAYTDALRALRLEDGYLEQLALAARRLTLREREASELRAALVATRASVTELRGIVRSADARRVAAERARDAWYRAPTLLLGVGAVLGAGLAVLLAFAVGGAS